MRTRLKPFVLLLAMSLLSIADDTTQTHAKKVDPSDIRYLVGTVRDFIEGGYRVSLAPLGMPMDDAAGTDRLYTFSRPLKRDPYLRAGYDVTVVLKTDKVYRLGESLAMPVIGDGFYTDSAGRHLKSFSELTTKEPSNQPNYRSLHNRLTQFALKFWVSMARSP
jgi:hypothetical protein